MPPRKETEVSNSQFVSDEEILLEDAFDALRVHFISREGFLAEYKRISDTCSKSRFLRLASVYRSLVKSGNFVPGNPLETSFNYLDITYKYIALLSIIEAVFSKDEWLDFHQWLSRPQNANVFPIWDQTTLEELYSQYNSEYGAIRNTVKFFKALEVEEQEFLVARLVRLRLDRLDNRRVLEIESTICDFAKLLYDIRSAFVHKAKLIVEFGNVPAITVNRDCKPFKSNLSLDDLMRVFEVGFIRHFGMRPERQILLP